MMYFSKQKKQSGIGLLELMLSMVIIAIMTLMAIQYFSSSKRNTLTTKAVDEIQDIVGIVSGLPDAHTISGTTGALEKAVEFSGKLPSEYIYSKSSKTYIASPWSTDATITTTNFSLSMPDKNTLTVTGGTDLPNWACQSLVDKFKAEATTGDCSDGLTLSFKLVPTDSLVSSTQST